MVTVPQGHPVAVVYYRYDSAVKPPAHGGFYYVHNGFAAKELTAGEELEAVIYHVPRWSSSREPELEKVTFCAESQAPAADAARPHSTEYRWEKDEATDSKVRTHDDVERLWVCKFIRQYSDGTDVAGHQPITWVETSHLDHPNNGAFEALTAKAGAPPVLHYWDWRNTSIEASKGEGARTATDPTKFRLTEGTEDKAGMAVVCCGPKWVDIRWIRWKQ